MLALTLGIALSGCTGGAKAEKAAVATAASAAEFSEDSGGVEGLVQSDDFVPLAGASVGIVNLEILTTTDAQGHFSLSNIPPGEQVINAASLGYGSQARTITVKAGEATSGVDFTLPQIAVPNAAGKISLSQRGMFGCGATVRPGAGVNVCAVFDIAGFQQYSHNVLTWNLDRPAAEMSAMVIEMQWTSNQALGKALSISLEVSGCSNSSGHEGYFAEGEGPSPVRYFVDQAKITKVLGDPADKKCGTSDKKCTADGTACEILTRVFGGTGTLGSASAADVGATVQQPYEHFLTVFYGPLPADVATFTVLEG